MHKCASNAEVQSVIHQWLEQQPAFILVSSIQKLVDGWNKYLDEFGWHVEYWKINFDI